MSAVGRHPRNAVVDDDVATVAPGPWFKDRRTWETYYDWQARYQVDVLRAAVLPLWQRIRRRQLLHALERWKRVDRILTAQVKFRRLVDHQRSYLLRKLLLKQYWRSVSLAYHRWVRVCRCYVRLERQVHKWQRKSAMSVAMHKWRSGVRVERLEEEAAACLCVLSLRKVERLAQRVSRRADRERLVSCWVQWKVWYRRQRCLAWRRGLSFAMAKYFIAWKRFRRGRHQQRLQVESFARGMVLSIMEDSVAQCHWRQRVRDQQTDQLSAIVGLLSQWMKRVQDERLRKSLSSWKLLTAAAKEAQDSGDPEPQRPASPAPAPITSKPRFPQRFSAAYRAQRRQQQRTITQQYPSQRPHWR